MLAFARVEGAAARLGALLNGRSLDSCLSRLSALGLPLFLAAASLDLQVRAVLS